MGADVFARIFISFIVILTTTTLITSTAISCSGIAAPLPRFATLLAVLGAATGLFYFILTGALRRLSQKQEAEDNRKKELEQIKASLTASMSHELRTPLNAIIGFTGIILQGMSGEINKRQRDQLERVLDSAKKLLSMIVDLINIAKIDAGSTGTFPTTFFLDEAAKECVHELSGENHPNFKGVMIEVDVSPEIQIYNDRKKLMQCIINTLICIVECTGIKSITVTAHEAGKHLNIIIGTSRPGPDREQLNGLASSMDTGEPVPEERAGNSIRLHLTKKMISELLGGNMSINTESGNGRLLQLTFSSIIGNKQQI